MRMKLPSWTALGGVLALVSCQGYPFEERLPHKTVAHKITEVVATLKPTDILLVIDSSGTMERKRELLVSNVALFAQGLIDSASDFQVGVVTTDVDCNLPIPAGQSCTSLGRSENCCSLHDVAAGGVWCTESDTNGDGIIDTSSCDGGRLRSVDGVHRIFTKPAAADVAAWETELSGTIQKLACNLDSGSGPLAPPGSAYQSGLEAAYRAIACAVDDPGCPDPAIHDLNQGFIRADADLVLVFLSGSDDCSFADATVYQRPPNPASANDQAVHLCGYQECYASYGAQIDFHNPGDGLWDWSDWSSAYPAFKCSSSNRVVNPPLPDAVSGYLDKIVALKGGNVKRVRGAAIVSGIPDARRGTGFTPGACFDQFSEPSVDCSCLFTSPSPLFCQLTHLLPGQHDDGTGNLTQSRFPAAPPPPADQITICNRPSSDIGGCHALPGTRYKDFLSQLAQRHTAALAAEDVLLDSLCQSD
jgi:hypothetical protein